jgi:RTX calcium-binding nonapeptide repeat (4 copies)
MRRARVVLTALGAAALLAPAMASATVNVSLVDGTLAIVGSAGDDTIVLGTAGSNALGPTTRVTGGAEDLQAGPGCQGFGDPNGPANANSIFCPTNNILRLQVDLLDGDDAFDTGGFEATVNGGPGEDEITIGRSGSDGVNTIDGGPDNDIIDIGRASEGDDIAGGPGLDTVDYASHSAVTVTLDGFSNDGTGGEQDNVRPDVEHVIGTSADDTLIGSDGPNTLDGANGTDRLEGLGEADTLIGGLGANDTTFGGAGNDTIMLRDGLRDACAVGGSGLNTVDVDLIDIQTIPGTNLGGTTRCLVPRNAPSPLLRDIILAGAVDEGPNVRMTIPTPALRRAGVRVRLACPAVLRRPCAGPLAVFTARGTRALGSIDYSVRPGRVAIIVVPLGSDARETALAAATLRIVSVEKGRSPLGPKTTVRFVAPRGS